MLPGHATCRNLSRSSPYHERTFARWYARDFDWVSLNKAAITEVVSPAPAQALVMEASFVPKRGRPLWPRSLLEWEPSPPGKGREISPLAWLDITHNCAYCLSVAQTPPTGDIPDPEATRREVSLDQLTRVVTAHDLNFLRSVVTAGYSSQQKFVAGVGAWGLHPIGTWRADANLRYLYQGPKRPGPGRQKTSDGQGNWSDFSRFAHRATEDEHIVLYHQVVNHVQCKRNLQVVVVVDTHHNRSAVRFSTDVGLTALTLYRYDKARFHIALLFRDAKQCTGLSDCQARSEAKLDLHFMPVCVR